MSLHGSISPSPYAPAQHVRWGKTVDIVLAVFAVAWTAETMGLLPVPQTALTILIYAGFCARFQFFGPELLAQLLKRPWLVLFPLLCLMSTLWSPAPQATISSALQLGFTIAIGLYLGLRFEVSELALLICVGLGLGILTSALIWPLQLDETIAPGGGYQGVFLQKNGLGQRSAMFLVLAIMLMSVSRGWPKTLGAGAICVALVMLLVSQSVTSWLLGGAALIGGLFWQSVARRGVQRALGLVILCTAFAAILSTLVILQISPVTLLLDHFDKAPDLTGRLVLWEVAQARTAEAPILGQGYMSYWKAPEFAQEVAALRAVHGPTVGAFHNFLMDVLVGTGAVGVIAIVFLLLGVARDILSAAEEHQRRWCVVFISLVLGLSLLGSSLYRPHEVVVVVLVALAVACSRSKGAAPEP